MSDPRSTSSPGACCTSHPNSSVVLRLEKINGLFFIQARLTKRRSSYSQFGWDLQCDCCITDTGMEVSVSLIHLVDSVGDLDVLIDGGLTLSNHVNKVATSCYFYILIQAAIHNSGYRDPNRSKIIFS